MHSSFINSIIFKKRYVRWLYVCITYIFAKTENSQAQFGAVELRQSIIFFPFKKHG